MTSPAASRKRYTPGSSGADARSARSSGWLRATPHRHHPMPPSDPRRRRLFAARAPSSWRRRGIGEDAALRRLRRTAEQCLGCVPLFADAEIIAARLRVEIVVERPQLPVLELHPHQAGTAGNGGGHLLDDASLAPLPVIAMGDDVVEPQIEAES